MKTKRYLIPICLLTVLLLAVSAPAQYTFGPEVQSGNANITYDSGTGLFQYTDSASSGNDHAILTLTGTAATYVTTSNGWTVSLAANLSATSMTATGDNPWPNAFWELGVLYGNVTSPSSVLFIELGQVNNTGGGDNGDYPDGFYGTVTRLSGHENGADAITTPLGNSQSSSSGSSYLQLSGGIGTPDLPVIESMSAVNGSLTLNYNAATKIVTGYYNGTPVGSYSIADWGSDQPLTIVVVGASGEGVAIPVGTATASNFSVSSLSASAPPQFQWAETIASIANWPQGEPNIGLALDTNDNCYVTGYFDGTNNFGGITLTNQSVGGSDIFVAKYNATGAAQWVQRAGGTSINYGRGIGLDTNGNIYVTGGYQGPATFGGINLPATSGEEFFLAKYNNAGKVQWVQASTGGSDDVYGIGLAADGAGNSYALVVVDDLGGAGGSVTFGSTTVTIPALGGTTLTILVKYDSTGTVKWTQLFNSSQETYATKLAVDTAGNVYVRGGFDSDMTIGTSNLVVSAGSTENAFIAKFDSSGDLIWIQQPQGGNVGEGGVTVDPAGNVYVSGYFDANLDFGGGITLASAANNNALFGDAFLAKYNSSGVVQWAQAAGDTNGGFYWDLALDAQTNIYAAGFLGSDTAVAKYSPDGMLQWTESASGPPASPVSSGVENCAVDPSGNCYLAGFYQGTTTLDTTTLQPLEAWNFFLAEVDSSNVVASPTIQTTGASFGVRTNRFGFNITGGSGTVIVEAATNLTNPVWIPVATNTLTGGTSYFSDPQWTNYPGRFYRISAP